MKHDGLVDRNLNGDKNTRGFKEKSLLIARTQIFVAKKMKENDKGKTNVYQRKLRGEKK